MQGRGERVRRFGEGFCWYDGGCERRGRVEVLQEGSTERYDGHCRVDGDAGEQWEVLAAMDVSSQMRRGWVGEQNERECGDMSADITISLYSTYSEGLCKLRQRIAITAESSAPPQTWT